MRRLIEWAGSGFAFAVGVLCGGLLMRLASYPDDFSREKWEDTTAQYQRVARANERQADALERAADALEAWSAPEEAEP